MERWGAVLARPHLQRYTEAATYYENAALKARSPLQAVLIINRCAWGGGWGWGGMLVKRAATQCSDSTFLLGGIGNASTAAKAVALPLLPAMPTSTLARRRTYRGQAMLTEGAQVAVPVGRTPDFPVRVPADTQVLERLARCMAARRPVRCCACYADGVHAMLMVCCLGRLKVSVWAGPYINTAAQPMRGARAAWPACGLNGLRTLVTSGSA